MWNGRAGLGCVLSVWLFAAAPSSRLQAALFFVPHVGGAKDSATTPAVQGKSADPSVRGNRWQWDQTKFEGNEGVSDFIAPLPTLNHPELLKSYRSPPSTMDDQLPLGSHKLQSQRRSELATELSTTGVVASCPRGTSMVPAAMSREIFEEYFRNNYLRFSRKVVRPSLVRSVERGSSVSETGRSRGFR
jgi:hypothetical protein